MNVYFNFNRLTLYLTLRFMYVLISISLYSNIHFKLISEEGRGNHSRHGGTHLYLQHLPSRGQEYHSKY